MELSTMAVASDSTTAPSRTLLRAAGPCAVLDTADVLTLVADVRTLPMSALLRPARLPSLSDALARRAAVFGPFAHDEEGF